MEKTALLKRLYSGAGQKEVKLLLYLVFFALHMAISSASYLPSIDPNEFTAAALANMFTGTDWTAAMSRSDYFYGFLQSLLYIPAVLITKDPFIQYHIMIGINALVMSFVPVFAYSCSRMMGLEKTLHSLFAAVCCGGWMTYMIHSSFIWNETMAIFLPWLAFWLLLRADRAAKNSTKSLLSILLGLVAAISYCAHQRLFALILALAVTVILLRAVFRRKIVNIPAFFITLGLLLPLAVMANYLVQARLWGTEDPTLLQNTAEHFFVRLPSMLESAGIGRFFTSLLSQLFYFISASWGLGALGISFLVGSLVSYISFRRKNGKKARPKASPVTVMMTFTFLLTLFMLFISVCYRFAADNFDTSQSTVLFGRYLDSVIPFTVLAVPVYVRTRGLTIAKISGGIISAAAVYICFFLTGRGTVLNADYTSVSPVLGLYPVMFGESMITSTGLMAAISCTMCMMAVLLVIVSCAKNLKNTLIIWTVTAVSVYSLCFGSLYYLPMSYAESVDKNEQYVQVSQLVFNSSDAPPVTVYRGSRGCVMMLQYLNQNTTVYTAENLSDIRDDTYLVVPVGVNLPVYHSGVSLLPMGSTESYRVFAYGEWAVAYARSQSVDSA